MSNVLQKIWASFSGLWNPNRAIGPPLSSNTRVISLATPEVFSPLDSTRAINDGFSSNISVYSIVKKDAKKFGSVPIYVYDAAKKEEKAIRHPLLEIKALSRLEGKGTVADLTNLLNRPNKQEGQDMFLARTRAYFKVCGESFIWLNRGDLEQYRNPDGSFDDDTIDTLPVLEMQVLPSNYISIIPDPTDLWGIMGYVLEVGERLVIRRNDVIHWKDINLKFDASSRTHLRGMSPLLPGSKTLSESDALSFASMRSAQNDGAKAVIYNKDKASITPTQQSEMKRVIDSKINNSEVADSVASLQGDWGLLNLSMSAKDQALIERKDFSWKEICFLLDVPNEFFDTKTTFANKKEALLGWVTNDIIPACKQFCGELNRVLLKAFNLEAAALIAADWSELPEIKQGMVDSAKVLQDIWSIAPDDVRDFLGYERLGGKFDEPWVTTGRTPMSDIRDPDEELALEIEKNRINAGFGNRSNAPVS